jgi:hypothetical protein
MDWPERIMLQGEFADPRLVYIRKWMEDGLALVDLELLEL